MQRLLDEVRWKINERHLFRESMRSGYNSELSSLLSWFEQPLQAALQNSFGIHDFLSVWGRIQEATDNLKKYDPQSFVLDDLDSFLLTHLEDLEELLTKPKATDTKALFCQKSETWRVIKKRVTAYQKKITSKPKRKRTLIDQQDYPPIPVASPKDRTLR